MPLSTRPLFPKLGVEVIGIDLSQEISDQLFSEICELYFQHSLLLFRNQVLSPARQAAFSARFGTPKLAPRKQFNMQEHPSIALLGNIKNDDGTPAAFFNRQGVEWHSDTAGNLQIDNATFLYAVEVPSRGGDTMYCSMYTAYETLPDELKEHIAGLRVLHSFNYHNDKVLAISQGSARPLTPEERAQYPDVWHDVVQIHPMSGRPLYYVSEQLARRFAGMTEEESRWLVNALVAHATMPERVYRHTWRAGDFMLWDNRAVMHSATEVDTYEHERRLMHRSSTYTHFPPRFKTTPSNVVV